MKRIVGKGRAMSELLRLVKAIQNEEDFSENALWDYFEKDAEEQIVLSKIGEVLGRDACRARAREILVKTAKDYEDCESDVFRHTKFIHSLYLKLHNARIAILANEKGVSIDEFMKMLSFETAPSTEAWHHLCKAEELSASIEDMKQKVKDHEDIARGVLVKVMKATILRWKELQGKDVIVINLVDRIAYRCTVKTEVWSDIFYKEIPICIAGAYIMTYEEYKNAFRKYNLEETWNNGDGLLRGNE